MKTSVVKEMAREAIFKIKPYVPGKPVEEVERELGIKNAVKLASNENPLGASPKAVKAILKHAASSNYYPDGNCYYLLQALSAVTGFKPEEIIVGNGSDEILVMLAAAFLNPGDEIVMAEPSFSEYDFASMMMDAKAVKVPLKNFTHDLKAMARAVTPRTKIIFVCNPNNPTGTIVAREEVEAWLQALPENILVVFDEAYYEYVDNDRYPQSLEYVRQGKNVVVLRTFSKIYGLAGLRVGYGIAHREIVAAMNRVRQPFNVNNLAQKAALAALDDQEFVAKSKESVSEGKKYLYEALEEMGLFYVPTEANFIFIDTGMDCGKLFPRLLQKGIIIRTGDIFNYPTFIRLTVGTMRDNERFITALKEVLAG